MYRFFICFALLFLSLEARENPFFPVDSSQDIPVTTNQVENLPPLKRASIELPSTARVVEEIIVRYKNLDGSIATKSIELEHAVDWHLPLFISQEYCSSKKVLKEEPKSEKASYKEIAKLPFISFYINHKKMKIITKDKLLRHFLLVKPHRIVCDFARDTDIRSYIKNGPKGSLFKKLRIGTHKGYYRVVIELDGYYTYIIKKDAQGYVIRLE